MEAVLLNLNILLVDDLHSRVYDRVLLRSRFDYDRCFVLKRVHEFITKGEVKGSNIEKMCSHEVMMYDAGRQISVQKGIKCIDFK